GDWQAGLWRRVLPRVGGESRAARVDAWLREFDPEYAAGKGSLINLASPVIPAQAGIDFDFCNSNLDPGFRRDDEQNQNIPGGKSAPPGLPSRLACFACANVSPDVLRMLAVAGRHCDVDFYLPLPSVEYLGDLPRTRAAARARLAEHGNEHPLIVSLGGALAEFVELLYGYQQLQPDEEIEQFDESIPGDSLLCRLRNDLLLDRAHAPDARRDAEPDASLQFHACHSELREIETLHDALLALLDADKTLQPRDIAVMTPDVARYQPAIEAVFGGVARDDPRWLPWSLGDAGAASVHPAAALLLKMLDAPTSRWELDELGDVLAAPGVQRRLDLDPDAVARLVRRLREAGVRWGEDERARAGAGDYREFSWAFGIERVVAGFAGGDTDALVGGTAPLAGVEGQAFTELDAMLAVTDVWRHLRELAREPRAPRAWQHELNAALDALYQPDPQDVAETRALDQVRGALARLAEHAAPEANLKLPWAVLRDYLREQLAAPAPQQRLFTGGITFCGMVPLRVVPFRVICLVGMDASAFPRRESGELDPLLADRRAGRAERGDRDVRADDRLLFLQLLAAARDTFYVSWIGRDARTNAALQSSAVVAELMDCVRAHYLAAPPGDACKALLPRVEPLHPFDPKLFAADANDARSYQARWLPTARAPGHGADALPRFVPGALAKPAPATALTLDELKRFLTDPARGFLERGLELRLPWPPDEDPDREPLAPGEPLLRYDLTRALLESGDADAAAALARLRAEARVPPGSLGDEALAIAEERAAALRKAIAKFTGNAPPLPVLSGSVELPDGSVLSGSVDDIYAGGLLRAKPGKLDGKLLLRASIDALFTTLLRRAPTPCRLCWIDKDGAQAARLHLLQPNEALDQIVKLVAASRRGLREPLPLLPNASWAALKALMKKPATTADEFSDNLRDGAVTAAGDYAPPGSDFNAPAVRMAWRGFEFTRFPDADGERFWNTACELYPQLVDPDGTP
ncbi:MAG TPA: exodeoxyribonuclease V subunit gamma, partial [Rhodanobacteraceae bacterium]